MAVVTFKGSPMKVVGVLPAVGAKAPFFKLASKDLSDLGPDDSSDGHARADAETDERAESHADADADHHANARAESHRDADA